MVDELGLTGGALGAAGVDVVVVPAALGETAEDGRAGSDAQPASTRAATVTPRRRPVGRCMPER
ncbi:hypothetical protein ASE38_09605 [Cellulomonas sp. Root930]|nr:hypothetical protein ASE38_09605 [Cellulomonas sp. Root930]